MTDPNHKSRVQRQFGRSADDYVSSDVHAMGESLQTLLDLVSPQDSWHVLDVATGAGHTAIAFAPFVKKVTASDITDQMLAATKALADERRISNLETAVADAESLPFQDNSFDLVTCRLAFHHFMEQEKVLCEFARVLKPDGVVGFTDNYTVDDAPAADFYNRYEKIRDPSHHWVRSLNELSQLFADSGLKIRHSRTLTKEFEFHKWADRQRVSDEDKVRLLEMLDDVPEDLEELMRPRLESTTAFFSLAEVVFVADADSN